MDVFSVQRSSQMISESLSSVAAALENGELEIAESKLNEILATVPNSPEALNPSGLVSFPWLRRSHSMEGSGVCGAMCFPESMSHPISPLWKP